MVGALIVAVPLLSDCSARGGRVVQAGSVAGGPTAPARANGEPGTEAAANEGAPAGDVPADAVDAAPSGTVSPAAASRDALATSFQQDTATNLSAAATPRAAESAGAQDSSAGSATAQDGANDDASRSTDGAPISPVAWHDTAAAAAGGNVSAERGTGSAGADGALVAALQTDLLKERRRREQAERDLQQLREETSSGPFENSLDKAHRQIAELQTELESERKMREKLAHDFEALRGANVGAPNGAADDATQLRVELASLKREQQQVLASVGSELAASQERERDLAAKLRLALDSPTSPPFEKIADLTKENLALRARLDEEHRQNRELASKLETAQRVADLIFKMQATRQGGAPPVEVAPASEARRPGAPPVPPQPAARAEGMAAPTRTPQEAYEQRATATPRAPRPPRPTRTPTRSRPVPPPPPPAPPAPQRRFNQQFTTARAFIPLLG